MPIAIPFKKIPTMEDIICFKHTVPEVDLSNFLTLTADKKKLLSPLQSEDI